MIQNISIKNFKKLNNVSFEIGNPVVFVGPNNSGKTTALQAIGLWAFGIIKWYGSRKDTKSKAKKRTGVSINRNDILMLPVPSANLLWNKKAVRRGGIKKDGKSATKNVVIQITVKGQIEGRPYEVGFEFDYANSESFYVRLLTGEEHLKLVIQEKVAFLQAMSGLAKEETKLPVGAIDRFIGEGKTAEVLRNVCYQLFSPEKDTALPKNAWKRVKEIVENHFGIKLSDPDFIAERGIIEMNYEEAGGKYDLSSLGRGTLQVILLLSYLFLHPNTILLLDEPDAHLEILRQREIYNLLIQIGAELGSQIIIASHSEVVLNEAADKNTVVAFIGQPHVLSKKAHLQKGLTEIGWEKYLQAEQKGYVLFLEGSTDLVMLQKFAEILKHDSLRELQQANVFYINNNSSSKAQDYFYALKEAYPELKGFAIFDRLENCPSSSENLKFHCWKRRELENYFCYPEILSRFAESLADGLFSLEAKNKMDEILKQEIPPVAYNDPSHNFWKDTKVSDDFLPNIFKKFKDNFSLLGKDVNKGEYYRVISFLKEEEIDREVKETLDAFFTHCQKS